MESFSEVNIPDAVTLLIQLFGAFALFRAGVSLPTPRTRKGQWLLALLLLRKGQAVDRVWLAGTLWPDSTDTQAKENLRTSLKDLRQDVLGPDAPRLLAPTPRTLAFDTRGIVCDLLAFDAALVRGDATSLERAITLYRGELLEGCDAEWVFAEREERKQAYLNALETLAARASERKDYAVSVHHLRLAVTVDPLRESGQRALMQALSDSGDYGASALVYRELRILLHRELNVEPDPQTVTLFQQIQLKARLETPGVQRDARVKTNIHLPALIPANIPAEKRPLPPRGILTFLFTDIVGSTKLWDQYPDAMRDVQARHDALVRKVIEAREGYIFMTAGDSFGAAFVHPTDALQVALRIQQSINSDNNRSQDENQRNGCNSAPTEIIHLQVKIALHTGEAEERNGAYFGAPLYRTNRLLSIGRSGQILLSRATWQLVYNSLPEGTNLQDMGWHELKGLQEPEHIYQLMYPDLPADLLPLKSLTTPEPGATTSAPTLPTTPTPAYCFLPRPLTALVGRNKEIETIRTFLTTARLVTLTGIGGTGKTRLAIAAAEESRHQFPGGIFFVSLMDVLESERLTEAVRDGLGLSRAPNTDPFVQIADKLSAGPCLLLLDNFEHVLEKGTAFVQKALNQIPLVTILVTSRQALHLHVEQEFPVSPLSLPAREEQTLERITESESVQLFLAGAKARRPDFALTPGNAFAIAGLCQRLDGLPLAIELAAAWVHLLTPAQMIDRLREERFALLVNTHKDQPERHQTMRAVIDWSFCLLEEPVRQFAARLSIFRGGWTVETAQTVCSEPKALPYLRQLYDVSLLQVEERNEAMRYRYLETVREYATEQLAQPERTELARSHRDFFLGLVEEIAPQLMGDAQGKRLDRLETEHDNLRAALAWCSRGEAEDVQTGFRLADRLKRFWGVRGYFREGEEHLRRLLARTDSSMKTVARARALSLTGNLAARQGEYTRAQPLTEEALYIFRELGDTQGIARELDNLGASARHFGNLSLSRSLIEEGLRLRRELGDRQELAGSLVNLGCTARDQGDLPAAKVLLEEALQFYRESGNPGALTETLHTLGLISDRQRAWALHEECLSICREMGDQWGVGRALNSLGIVAQLQGDFALAGRLFEDGLRIYRDLGHKQGEANSLRSMGSMALQQGHFARACALFEEALNIFRKLDHQEGIAHSLLGIGNAAGKQEDFVRARTLIQESLIRFHHMDYKLSMAAALEGLAALLFAQAEVPKAVCLWRVARTQREILGGPVPPREHQEKVEQARSFLGETAFAVACAEGQVMTLEEAVRHALA